MDDYRKALRRRFDIMLPLSILLLTLSLVGSSCSDTDNDQPQTTQTPTATSSPTETPTPTATPTATPPYGVAFERTYSEGIGLSVQQTDDGGYILCGGVDATTSFLLKTDEQGTELWFRTFEDTDLYGDWIYAPVRHSVDQTTDGGFVLSLGNRIVKLDESGVETWRIEENTCTIRQTGDHGYIAAWKNSFQHHTGSGYLSKLNEAGEIIWERDVRGIFDAIELTDGSFLGCGTVIHTNETANFSVFKTDSLGNSLFFFDGYYNSCGGKAYSVAQTNDEGFIAVGYWSFVKIDSQGVKEWSRTIQNEFGTGYAVQQTADGGYLVGGNSAPSNQRYEQSTYGFILKTDREGNSVSHYYIDGLASGIYSIQKTSDGRFIAVGSRNGLIYLLKMDIAASR